MTTLLERLQDQLTQAQDGRVSVTAADLLLLLEKTTEPTDAIALGAEDLQHLLDQAAAVAAQGGRSLESYMENIQGRHGPAQLRPLLELTSGQVQQLADIAGDEGPVPLEDQNTLSVQAANGHSGEGLYAWATEYPEDGAYFLDGIPPQHREAFKANQTSEPA